ncbi:hypothetical protein SRIMM317S_00413 [Streptomyces rimosus subsp. rimosus]
MTLPPPISTVPASSPCTGCTSCGRSARVRYWLALSTKHRPSKATCRIVACQLSLSSTVGAHQISTFLVYIAVRNSGM